MPLFKKDGKLAAQFNEQILLAVRVLHHKSDILVFHIVKIIFRAGVHGYLLAAQQHQQLPLLFGGVKIALRAVPIGDHRCSSIYNVCGRFFPPNDPFNPFPHCRLRALPLRRELSARFWHSRAHGRRGLSP